MSPKRAAADAHPSQPATKRTALAQEDETSSPRAKLVELVENGGVLIVAGQGENELNIKVSGTVITLASKHFARMLSGLFIEANARTIRVKDDDPEAVLDVFRVLHYDFSCVEEWDGRQMTLVADLAEIWDCVYIFKPHIITRMTPIIDEMALDVHDPDRHECISDFLEDHGFCFQHVLEIASRLDMKELLVSTVKAAIVQSPELGELSFMPAAWTSAFDGGDFGNIYGESQL